MLFDARKDRGYDRLGQKTRKFIPKHCYHSTTEPKILVHFGEKIQLKALATLFICFCTLKPVDDDGRDNHGSRVQAVENCSFSVEQYQYNYLFA